MPMFIAKKRFYRVRNSRLVLIPSVIIKKWNEENGREVEEVELLLNRRGELVIRPVRR